MERIAKLTIVATKPGQWQANTLTVDPALGRATCQQLRADGWTISATFARFTTQEAR